MANRLLPWVVGVSASCLSLLRLVLQSHAAIGEVLWAEYGLFPLCVVKNDTLSCLLDPFAGYLLFVPRAVAGVVALFPMQEWAWVANLAAAAVAGLAAGIAFATLRREGFSWAASLLVALLIVIAPIVGLEAINAVGSAYIPLLFASSIVVAYPPHTRGGLVAAGLLLAVTIVTIPSAIVLVLGIVIVAARGRVAWRVASGFIGVLGLGGAAQWFVGRSAETPRSMEITTQGLTDWISALPLALVSFWPGLYFGEATTFGIFVIPPFALTGLVLAALAVGVGVWSATRGNPATAVLLLSGFGLGAIPTLTGYANNRYFVLPAILWGAALVLAVDARWGRVRRWLMPAVLVGCLVVWWSAFPASPWRAGASPQWSAEVERLSSECRGDPGRQVQVRFTPDWPMEMTVLDPITTADALCIEIREALGVEGGNGFQ
jgi:hypothetical protein